MLNKLLNETKEISKNLEIIRNGGEVNVLDSNETVENWLDNNLKRTLKILYEVACEVPNKTKKEKELVSEALDWSERQTSVLESIRDNGFDKVIGGNETFLDWAEYEIEYAISLINNLKK